MNKKIEIIGIVGSVLGICAGLVELLFGEYILPWIGNKENPVTLGIITMLLSGVVLFAIYLTIKGKFQSNDQKIGLFLMYLIPTLVCFTTVGRLWYLPGGLLLITSGYIFYHNWIRFQDKDKMSQMTKFNKKQKIDLFFSLLIVSCVAIHFFVLDFSFFSLEIRIDNVLVTYQVIPMDFIRYTNLTSFETIDYETIEIMIMYLFIIIGASIALISSLIKSRVFAKIGIFILLLALTGFLIMINPVIMHISSEYISVYTILSSLGVVYFLLIISSIIILINKKRTH